MSKPKEIPLDKIRLVEGVQQREKIDQSHVNDLADALRDGAALPPARVRFDGTDYVLSRGFHRYLAHKRMQFASMPCEVLEGGVRDAVLDAIGTNDDHGLKRTNADKRKEVTTLLLDKEWGKNSDSWIGETAKVDHKTVAKVRADLTAAGSLGKSQVRVGKDGRTQDTTNIGKKSSEVPEGETELATSDDDMSGRDDEPVADPAEAFYSGDPEPEGWQVPDPKKAAKEFDLAIRELGDWEKRVVENLIDSDEIGTEFLAGNKGDFKTRVSNLRELLQTRKPYCVCPKCKGERCELCRQSGLVPKRFSSNKGSVPVEASA